jgi:hypothetical protein
MNTMNFSRSVLVIAFVGVAAWSACSSDDAAPNHAADGGKQSAADAAALDGRLPDGAPIKDPGFQVLPDGAIRCGEDEVTAAPRRANMLLVIDESGSMKDKPDGFEQTKWAALESALAPALRAVQDDVAFGLQLFPHSGTSDPIPLACTDDCCEMPDAPGITVPVAEGSAAVDAILAALDTSAPGGGTPTALALSRALDYFTTGAGKDLSGDKFVLLATDGGPNCNEDLSCGAKSCTTNLDGDCTIDGNCCDPMFGGAVAKARCLDDDATLAQIEALAKAGVDTFVVGIPGSETYADSLDAFAAAGGRENPSGPPKYYAVSASGGVAGLAKTLDLVTKNVITSCRQQLQMVPPNSSQLNVYVDDVLIHQAGADGWVLDFSTTPPTVVLQGETCATVQSRGAKSVRVLYGCPTAE